MPTPFEQLLKTDPNAAYKQAAGLTGQALTDFVGSAPPPSPPAGGTVSPPGQINYVSRIGATPAPAPAPIDEESIREASRKRAQSIVNAINAQFAPLFEQQTEENKRNEARTRAMNISSGLGGSDFASAAATETEKRGGKALDLLREQQAAKIEEILTAADERASTEIANAKTNFRLDTESYLKQKADAAARAKEDVAALVTAGVDLSKLKTNEPNTYVKLLNQAGFDSELAFDSYFNSLKKKAEQVDYKYEITEGADGKKYILAYGADPKTGQLVTYKYDAGITGGQKPIIVDGVPYYQDPNNANSLIKATGFQESDKSKLELEKIKLQNAKLRKDIADTGKAYLNEPLNAIEQLKGEKDGYVNPAAYRDLYAQFVKDNPGKGDEFLKNFPVSIYINPDEQYQFSK